MNPRSLKFKMFYLIELINKIIYIYIFHRLEERRKEEEYERKLSEMGKKIDTRKLQIEQVDEENIRRALEKKYSETLKKAGINENELKRTR